MNLKNIHLTLLGDNNQTNVLEDFPCLLENILKNTLPEKKSPSVAV